MCFKIFSLFIFISLSLKPSSTANILVIDVKNLPDTLLDDYGPIHELDDIEYDYNVKEETTKQAESSRDKTESSRDKTASRGGMCHRLFTSIYGKSYISCLENIDTRHGRGRSPNLSNKVRQKKIAPGKFAQDYFDIRDLGRTRKDDDFADDYYDVDGYARSYCNGTSEECYKKLSRRFYNDRPVYRSGKSTSDSSEDASDDISYRAVKKPYRFQVINNDSDEKYNAKKRKPTKKHTDDEDSDDKVKRKKKKEKKHKSKKYSDDSEVSREVKKKVKKGKKYEDDSDISVTDKDSDTETAQSDESGMLIEKITKKPKTKIEIAKKGKKYKDDSDSMESNSDSDRKVISDRSFEFDSLSEEVTKKPKVKKSKTEKDIEDGYYVYLQGNKLYDINDYRRKRLPHFLPKRIKWEEDDLPKLSYYWFDGPAG